MESKSNPRGQHLIYFHAPCPKTPESGGMRVTSRQKRSGEPDKNSRLSGGRILIVNCYCCGELPVCCRNFIWSARQWGPYSLWMTILTIIGAYVEKIKPSGTSIVQKWQAAFCFFPREQRLVFGADPWNISPRAVFCFLSTETAAASFCGGGAGNSRGFIILISPRLPAFRFYYTSHGLEARA